MKKASFFAVALLVTLGLLVPAAAPVVACDGSTMVTISAEPAQVSAGETVVLTITETNDSPDSWVNIRSVHVSLEPLGMTLTSSPAEPATGDSYPYGVLGHSETWVWEVSVPVNVDTTFVATGYGEVNGVPLTYPEDPEEQASVTVTVTPNGGGEGLTPGYWKNHLDDWPVLPPGTTFLGIFGAGPDVSIGEALNTKGGNCKALVRHAAAAYLSILHGGVDYPIGLGALIPLVYNALDSGDCGAAKDEIVGYNELGGDLNG